MTTRPGTPGRGAEDDKIPLLQHPEPESRAVQDEDMWPGGDLPAAGGSDDFDLPPLKLDEEETRIRDEGSSESSSEIVHEKPTGFADIETTSEMVVLTQPIEALTREQEDAWGLPSGTQKNKWQAHEDVVPGEEEVEAATDRDKNEAGDLDSATGTGAATRYSDSDGGQRQRSAVAWLWKHRRACQARHLVLRPSWCLTPRIVGTSTHAL